MHFTICSEPIITSLLDIDFYKFTMGQLIFLKQQNCRVTFSLTNRTRSVKLGKEIDIDQLKRELDHVRTLSLSSDEIEYLRELSVDGVKLFREKYLAFLSTLRLGSYKLNIDADGMLTLTFSGPWAATTYWETIALSILSELYGRSQLAALDSDQRNALVKEGKKRLKEKIAYIKENIAIAFSDFGTRRRFSGKWQEYVVRTLAEALDSSQFVGTSNVYLAKKYKLKAIGTNAHELSMVYASFGKDLTASQRILLDDWWELYGFSLSTALTDTYGSPYFFREVFTKERACQWKGTRQDSGDPAEYGENLIALYKSYGIDPQEKLIVFSDGLNIATMAALAKRFFGRIMIMFGWGTNLTNDLGFKALSLVIKAVEADGISLVKLSDNIEKAIGDPERIEWFKQQTGYSSAYRKECVY